MHVCVICIYVCTCAYVYVYIFYLALPSVKAKKQIISVSHLEMNTLCVQIVISDTIPHIIKHKLKNKE